MTQDPTPQTPGATLLQLIGVYHANGGVVGELAYAAGILLGKTHCSLCDITHSGRSEKKAMADCRAGLPVPLVTVHLNERTLDVREFTEGRTPCVVAETRDGLVMLLEPEALREMAGDEARFATALGEALTAQGLLAAGD